jgi:hypothetical protein
VTAIVPSRLDDLEQTIERGLATFQEVGEALLAIRDERLYLETHPTFEAYVRERWGWERRHAYRLMEGADVARIVSPTGHTPANEAQARELVPLKDQPEAMREAWVKAQEQSGGSPTAAVVRQAVRSWIAEGEDIARASTESMSPATRERLSPERMRQQGEAMRLVHDLAALPDPVLFAQDHPDLPPRMIADAEAAHAWLTDFLSEWRASRERVH